MEEELTLLRDQDEILKDWSDRKILPGGNISEKIKKKMQETDIFVFLLSKDFIASPECRKEWQFASELASKRPSIVLVPIILSECSWQDLGNMSQLKALPNDANPIKTFDNEDTAWKQIYDGIKLLIDDLRKTFTVKIEFRKEMEKTEFISQEHIKLSDVFVFPNLSLHVTTDDEKNLETKIATRHELLKNKHMLIHGDELSGKTALCRHLVLTLIEEQRPVLYVNLNSTSKKASPEVFRNFYHNEFDGDYSQWKKQPDRIVILDNLSSEPHAVGHVLLAMELFDQVVVTLSSDTYYAYFRDDEQLASFCEVRILPFNHNKQQELIQKRLAGSDLSVFDSLVDTMENKVNDVVISNRILPRYPFYILTILQTCEGYMPNNLFVTSYGHCYHVLIVAHLIKSGVPKADDAIDTCFNFLENLAFAIFQFNSGNYSINTDAFDDFVKDYKEKFIIKNAILNRLLDQEFGVIKPVDPTEKHTVQQFRSPYMYFYFLGKFLAKNAKNHQKLIESMVDRSYILSNRLTLIFTIHHTNDCEIIDDILLHTMCAFEGVEPIRLTRHDVEIFEEIVAAIPSTVLSHNPIESERKLERTKRDEIEFSEFDNENSVDSIQEVNDIYRIMKNNEILGQILRNKHGSLERSKLLEIIETITDQGLKLVGLILGSQEEMNDFARFIHEKNPNDSLDRIKRTLQVVSFIWTITNIEKIVRALNKPEIQPLVQELVGQKNTPAYDLISYFLRLETMREFSENDRAKLKLLLNKHRYPFFQKVTSLRTQWYLNTHRVRAPLEQAICSLLGIEFRSKLKQLY